MIKLTSAPLTSGMPQGSFWAPFFFSLYVLPLGSIISTLSGYFHLYADDLLIYLAGPKRPPSTVSPVVPGLDTLAPHLNHVIRNLCVTLGTSLKLDRLTLLSEQASASFDSRLKSSPSWALVTLRKSFMFSLAGLIIVSMKRYYNCLKPGQNPAVLLSRIWLPDDFRIQLKFLLFIVSSLNNLVLSDFCEVLSFRWPNRALYSAGQHFIGGPMGEVENTGCFVITSHELWTIDLRN